LLLDEFLAQHMDGDDAYVPWSRVARSSGHRSLVRSGQRTGSGEHWYPSTKEIEQHLKQRYGELFQAETTSYFMT
jgi:hypothetical protein